MAVSIAEYLGQRTDVDAPTIEPCNTPEQCPFMDRRCDKLNTANPKPPICSVRKADGTIWITCEHRLCSTRTKRKDSNSTTPIPIGLVPHQTEILKQVANAIYRNDFEDSDIVVRRETSIALPESDNTYHADYIMRNVAAGAKIDEVLLEMQGGGETSSTGKITAAVKAWTENPARTNELLRCSVASGTIETNAWRRQQEQFLVKGNVVSQTGGKIVFAVGSLLYDYLERRFRNGNLRDLKKHNWTLCILAFKEDSQNATQAGSIPLIIDEEKTLFTNYSSFVRFLTDQGGPRPEIFEGDFLSLTGETITL